MQVLKYVEGPTIVIFIGAIIIAIGSVWAAVQNAKSNELLRERTEQLLRSETESRKKAEEIATLSAYNLKMITGGDSFPHIYPIFNVASPGQMDLMLMNAGRYPLYDVSVTIIDLVKFKTITDDAKRKGPLNLRDFTAKMNVGNMRPSEIVHDFLQVKTPGVGEIDYKFEIVSRNSFVEERLQIRFLGGGKREIVTRETSVNGVVIDPDLPFKKISRNEN